MDAVTVALVLVVAAIVPFFVTMARRANGQSNDRARRKLVLETGMPASATILSVEETAPYNNRVPHLSFELRVEPQGEPPFQATARGFFSMIDYPRLQPGLRVEVCFDPGDHSNLAIVGDKVK